jgi:hypothetical protein
MKTITPNIISFHDPDARHAEQHTGDPLASPHTNSQTSREISIIQPVDDSEESEISYLQKWFGWNYTPSGSRKHRGDERHIINWGCNKIQKIGGKAHDEK